MRKSVFAFVIFLSLLVSAYGQQTQGTERKPERPPSARNEPGFIVPSEVNVRIDSDVRTFVVMAALNLAGFDIETGNQPISPARAEIRRDLANLDPQLKAKLSAYYKSHRREGVDEVADAARYAALSLMMTQPPAFSVHQINDTFIPEDLKALLDFVPLVQEFYIKSGIKQLIPKYTAIAEVYAAAYRRPVGEMIYQALEYYHTRPDTIISMRPLVVSSETETKTKKQSVVARNRTRQVFIVPEPLAPINTSIVRGDILNQKEELLFRRIGDDYVVIVGPSRTPNIDAVRQALIRFVIDPVVERHLKSSLEYKDQIVQLVGAVPTAQRQYAGSVYLVIRESLAQATEARMRRLQAMQSGGSYSEDDATFDLAQAYLRGSVLSFHFYDSLIGLEKVGINIEDFFDQMVATTKFDREAQRMKEFEPVVARVSAARRSKPQPAEPTEAVMTPAAKKILLSDDLIRQRQFGQARTILEEILKTQPNNARALYGLAQVISQTPSKAELDPKAEENDKIQAQHDRLEQAIKLYRKAIENASPDTERWLIQWSHVYLGRIYDFQEFRQDALAEYEKAIALGPNVANGAYKEALEGKQKPHGQQ
jgi:tetratricopeptide (TPR) repeat protein